MAQQSQQQQKQNNLNRILVIQTAFLGDIVLLTSFLRELRKQAPHAEIQLLTTKIGCELLQVNPWNIHCTAYDKRGTEKGFWGFQKKVKLFRQWKPDIIFCVHRSMRSALMAKLIGAKSIIGFQDAAGSFLYTQKVSREGYSFEAEKNFSLVKEVFPNISSSNLFPELMVTESEKNIASELLAGVRGKKIVALSPSSVWATKRWPAEKFGSLAHVLEKKYEFVPIFIGGQTPEDIMAAGEAFSVWQKNSKDKIGLNLCGKTTVGVLKAVLSQADFVVANDSAPLHVAIAMGKKVTAIFGPTTKDLGFFPLAPEGMSSVAELSLSCRPCGKHGHKACPQQHFRCMLDLSVERVLLEVEKVIGI